MIRKVRESIAWLLFLVAAVFFALGAVVDQEALDP
jgi:hypothetical protein